MFLRIIILEDWCLDVYFGWGFKLSNINYIFVILLFNFFFCLNEKFDWFYNCLIDFYIVLFFDNDLGFYFIGIKLVDFKDDFVVRIWRFFDDLKKEREKFCLNVKDFLINLFLF